MTKLVVQGHPPELKLERHKTECFFFDIMVSVWEISEHTNKSDTLLFDMSLSSAREILTFPLNVSIKCIY